MEQKKLTNFPIIPRASTKPPKQKWKSNPQTSTKPKQNKNTSSKFLPPHIERTTKPTKKAKHL
jgi:hypothetical protein